MAEVIKMPRMSDTMTEGVIVQWLKKEGDTVKSGDVLAEVETDKATMELESYSDGTLLYIGVKEGQAVPVDGVLAVIGKPGENYQEALQKEGGAPKASGEQQQAQPQGNEQQQSAGEQNQQPQGQQQNNQQQQQQSTQSTEAQQQAQQQNTQGQQQQAAPQQQQAEMQQEEDRVKASPLAKKIANDKGIPLQQVQGSGDNGRIVRRDVENFQPQQQQQAPQGQQQARPMQPQVQGQEGFEDVPVSQMRKTIARRLAESKFSAPHFYLTIDINMDRAVQARKGINDFLGSKVSFNDMIIRAAAATLRRHPKVNGSWLGDKLRYYQHVHIGVAIAVEDGLVVPVVRFADQKGISQISQEVKEYADRAKNKKLQPNDFEGSTFTISNLGMFGIEEFTAIINPPAACILAVGAIQERPIVVDGEIKAANMMKVTMSCDHRIVDGATGAQFLQTFKQFMEEPVTILA
jgi:pyruvate dehydrogenase E2 component (dihydrolipoamide acetyltransferase)